MYNDLQNDLKVIIATTKNAFAQQTADPAQASAPLVAKFVEAYHKNVPFVLRLRMGALPLNLRKYPPENPSDTDDTDGLEKYKDFLADAKDVNLQISKMLIRFF